MYETQTALFMKLLLRRGKSFYVYVCVCVLVWLGYAAVIQGGILMTDCCWHSVFYILSLSLSPSFSRSLSHSCFLIQSYLHLLYSLVHITAIKKRKKQRQNRQNKIKTHLSAALQCSQFVSKYSIWACSATYRHIYICQHFQNHLGYNLCLVSNILMNANIWFDTFSEGLLLAIKNQGLWVCASIGVIPELVHADFLITRCVMIINMRCFLDRVLLDIFRSVSHRSDSPRVPLWSGCPTFWTHDGLDHRAGSKVEWHKCQNKSTNPLKHVRFWQFVLVFSSIHSSLLWWEIIWIFGGDNSSYLVCSWLSVMAYMACGAEQFMRLLSLLVLAHGDPQCLPDGQKFA